MVAASPLGLDANFWQQLNTRWFPGRKQQLCKGRAVLRITSNHSSDSRIVQEMKHDQTTHVFATGAPPSATANRRHRKRDRLSSRNPFGIRAPLPAETTTTTTIAEQCTWQINVSRSDQAADPEAEVEPEGSMDRIKRGATRWRFGG